MEKLKIIDWYIIRKYLSTFLFTVLIFTMIAFIIDFSEKVEKFIKEACTKQEIIFDYYLNWIPYINGLLIPLYALISVIFFTSRMAFNSEVISILNAGISFRRTMRPYLIAGGIIAIAHLVGNHFVIPWGNKGRLHFENTYISRSNEQSKTRDVHMFINDSTKVYIRFYGKEDSTARNFLMEQYRGNELAYMLKADEARWLNDSRRWRLKNYEIRTFSGQDESLTIGQGAHIDTLLNLVPEDFIRYTNQKEMMATPELRRFISAERNRGLSNTRIFEIELHRRTAEPFSILILTIIGLAVAGRKVRGGIGLHLAIGIGLGAIFIFLSKFSATFATNRTLPPVLGVWIPNVIFSAVAYYLVRGAQK
jgi:lipopolysaccharide export system permease protein